VSWESSTSAHALHCQVDSSDARAAAKRTLRSEPRQIGLLVYPGFDLLDLSGPLEAFFWAQHHVPSSYQLRVMSMTGGLVHGGPLRVETETTVRHGLDTLIVIGGRVDHATCDTELIEYVRAAGSGVRRMASVCTGAFVLAQAGLLDGRAATTHWSAVERLQTAFPNVRVRKQCIYVKDGNVWSSAGITAGIDLTRADRRGSGPRDRANYRAYARRLHAPSR
jgi:transcriptional regulator GlxA family with amidase domain